MESEKSLARDGLLDPRRRMLSGAVVMIGGHFAGVPDVIDTALHSGVPAVYAHAAALDNLMRFGSDFKRAGGQTLAGVSIGTIYTVGCVLVLFGVLVAWEWSRPRRSFFDSAKWLLLHLGVGMVLALGGYFILDLPMGITLTATLFAALPKVADATIRPTTTMPEEHRT
jgi:CHASE2 domain-containing sensor protein